MFSVRTPTAIVTDLGTEFGVEVDKSGATSSCVFQGAVEMRSIEKIGESTSRVRLHKGQSARVVAVGEGLARVLRVSDVAATTSNTFVRSLGKLTRFPFFNTGIDLSQVGPDPHWQITARSDDPTFKPQPAVVPRAYSSHWMQSDWKQSRWITMDTGDPRVPNGVVYTFQTTFELADSLPGTAALRCRFLVDNRVAAVRLNGREVPLPDDCKKDHGFRDDMNRYSVFFIREGFVEGRNTLEIDVANGSLDEREKSSPMGLRFEAVGTALSKQRK